MQLQENDIVLIEVPTHQRRLEYIKRNEKYGLFFSFNWCLLMFLPEKINTESWRVTKVGNTVKNPEYMDGRNVMYLEEGPETDDGISKKPVIKEEYKNEILKKII